MPSAPLLSRAPIVDRLRRETYALPVDVFRLAAGALGLAYYVRTILEAGDISHPDGFLDHDYLSDVFWFTRWSLFGTWLPYPVIQGAHYLACLACIGLVVGFRPRLCAGIAYAINVSTYRWNFLVMYVDDAIMHLTFFWLLILPTGRTLVLMEWFRDRGAAWQRWKREIVPGGTVSCFIGNLALLYLVAGLWKMTSPMWEEGIAVYATLRLPLSYAPEFWTLDYLPLLRFANDFSLALEPLLPVAFLLRRGHPAKWVAFVAAFGFHVGIATSLRVPYANIACIAGWVLVLRHEIMDLLGASRAARPLSWSTKPPRRAKFAFVFLVVLTAAMLRRTPWIGTIHLPAYGLLWLGGIAQDYQLFNWIDRKNYHADVQIDELNQETLKRRPVDVEDFFPNTTRGVLLRSYLHGVRWMKIPDEHRVELKRRVYRRFARRYCRLHRPEGSILVYVTVQRITSDNLALEKGKRRLLMHFRMDENGREQILYPRWVRGDWRSAAERPRTRGVPDKKAEEPTPSGSPSTDPALPDDPPISEEPR